MKKSKHINMKKWKKRDIAQGMIKWDIVESEYSELEKQTQLLTDVSVRILGVIFFVMWIITNSWVFLVLLPWCFWTLYGRDQKKKGYLEGYEVGYGDGAFNQYQNIKQAQENKDKEN